MSTFYLQAFFLNTQTNSQIKRKMIKFIIKKISPYQKNKQMKFDIKQGLSLFSNFIHEIHETVICHKIKLMIEKRWEWNEIWKCKMQKYFISSLICQMPLFFGSHNPSLLTCSCSPANSQSSPYHNPLITGN